MGSCKRFEEKRCFTSVRKYFISNPKNNTLVIATTDDKSPIMVLKDKGKGKIFYYGIFDDFSTFKLDKDYPIFWNNLINYLIGSEDIKEYNKRLGSETLFNYTKIGVYNIDNKMIAFNLLNEPESNINKEPEVLTKEKEFYIKPKPKKQKLSIEIPLMIFIIILVLFELIYLKIQGEL